ncbi:uncharacterized protein [Henckelia pumila]|uniref:uncharacterized protein n=1 Tax=Henckelia pumila TaxID=405737 RepID=UPI003C6EA114
MARRAKEESSIANKNKFDRKSTEDKEFEDDDLLSDEEPNVKKRISFQVGKFTISVDCATGSVVLPDMFKSKEGPADRVDLMQEDVSKEPCHGEHVNGHPISRVLIDNGSAVNILPLRVFKNLGKEESDLIPTEVSVTTFTGEATKTIGVFLAEVLVGSKASISAFFVVNSSANFQALLGRDWIHENHFIPSSMHQFLMFWIGDDVEIVQEDSQPFQASSIVVESRYYNGDFGPIKFYGKNKGGQHKSVYMETLETNPMFDGVLKTTVIAPPSPMIQPLIEEEPDSFEELQLEYLALAPSQLEDHQPQVQDPLEKVNLGDLDNPKPVYISALLNDELKVKMKELLAEFKDCFAWSYEDMSGLDRQLVEHRLPFKDDFKPYKQPSRRMSREVEAKVKEEIEKFVKAGFIRPIRYAEWLSNVVPVIKKNGKLKVCIDFRDLNRDTPKDVYVMPITDMLVDSVANNELLSFMDGYSGYNQIKIDERDTSKTAFRCPGAIGTFEWLVMSFGLKNAGATYQRAMNAIFHDTINHFIEVYIDDIVVKSRKTEDHVEHLRMSFERMRKHNLKLNPMKCAFGVKAGNFLGFLLHQRGVEVDQNKSKAILEARPPKNKKELQRFLGQVNYLRRFISNLAGKTKEFSQLLKLKESDEFMWEAHHQQAFEKIKEYYILQPLRSQ